MSSASFAIVVAIVVFTCAGCSSEPSEGGSHSAVARDSAGIRIVENVGVSGVESGWSISAEPIFRIGWGQGDPQLQFITYGFVGGDRVIFGDSGSQLVHIASSDGDLIATIGGEGEGPGEFGYVDGIVGLRADTFLVSDGTNQRVSTFAGPDLVRDVPFQSRVGDAGYALRDRAADGSFILVPRIFALGMDEPESGWRSYPIFGTTDFSDLDTVAIVPLFQNRPRGNVNPLRAYGTAVVTGGEIAVVRNDRPEITWMGVDGVLRRIVRWNAVVRTATDADWDVWERGYRARTPPTDDPARYEDAIEMLRRDFGGTIPVFGAVHGDSRGNVWLEKATLVRSTTPTYDIVAPTGEWLGSVELPRPMRILDITDDRILSVETDDFDVQAVALYPIEK